jgi:molybdopterin-guanine dinucleotide biosynthesis protein A
LQDVSVGVGTAVSAKRQDAILKALNKGGCQFQKNHPTYTELGAFKVCAADQEENTTLLTADDSSFANTTFLQTLCSQFIPQGWKVFLWTADDQSIHFVWDAKSNPENDSCTA